MVVTGIGVVSSLGKDPKGFWENIIAGKCGIHGITSFDVSNFTTRIAAEVTDFDPIAAFPSPKDARRTDRFAQFVTQNGWISALACARDRFALPIEQRVVYDYVAP